MIRDSQFIKGEKDKLEKMIYGTEKYLRTVKLLNGGYSLSKVPRNCWV